MMGVLAACVLRVQGRTPPPFCSKILERLDLGPDQGRGSLCCCRVSRYKAGLVVGLF